MTTDPTTTTKPIIGEGPESVEELEPNTEAELG